MPNEALMQALRQLYNEREAWLGDTFNRSIPFADAVLGNRWSRAERLGFGKGASIYDSSLVFGAVKIGEMTWIGPSTILDGSGGGLEVGSYCSISAGVQIYTHDTVLWALSGGKASARFGAVKIGDCCHIGAQSIILPGVTIGARCVVAANSVVNRNLEGGLVVGGSPAKIIGDVTGEGADVALSFRK